MELNDRELATVLAALRVYQEAFEACDGDLPDEFYDIATNHSKHLALTMPDIDALCERLNCVEPSNEDLDLYRENAREIYADDDLEIEDNATVSVGDDGA